MSAVAAATKVPMRASLAVQLRANAVHGVLVAQKDRRRVSNRGNVVGETGRRLADRTECSGDAAVGTHGVPR
jgi:hypothetical protein